MRLTRGWAGLCNALLAPGLAAALAALAAPAAARADAIASAAASTDTNTNYEPMMGYDTVGSTVSTAGVTGTPVVSFVPVTGGSFLAPSNLSFGTFVLAPQASGQSTTYANTPFTIKFSADSLNGAAVSPNQTPITVSGVLNGTATGGSMSGVTATFNSVSQPTFQTGLYSNSLSLSTTSLALVPSTTNGGMSTVEANLLTTATGSPVPEPSTVLLFAATIAGLGLRQRARALRARPA